MPKQKTSTWDVIQGHPIAKDLGADAQLALLCEYLDLIDELEGLSLAEYIDGYFAEEPGGAPEAAAQDDAGADEGQEPEAEAEANGKPAAKERPKNMTGMRVVYKFPGRNILANADGVTRDSGGVVSFTDVDGEEWTNVSREKVHVIEPENHFEIHVTPREAKEFNAWLSGGKTVKGHADGEAMRNLKYEFTGHPDKVMLVIMNGKKPYVDRFVQKPDGGFEDDQKPTTRLFGEHCFRVQKVDYICNVVTP